MAKVKLGDPFQKDTFQGSVLMLKPLVPSSSVLDLKQIKSNSSTSCVSSKQENKMARLFVEGNGLETK